MLRNVTSLRQHFQEHDSSFVINGIPENGISCLVRGPNTVNDYEFCLNYMRNIMYFWLMVNALV